LSEAPSHPTVSTGAAERFLSTLASPDLREAGVFTVQVERRGRRFSVTLNPDFIVSSTKRITGKLRRKLVADYLVQRDGNRCALRFPGYCLMGDKPFPHPEKANFDHISGINEPPHRLKDLRLACAPCNQHAQTLQWKSIRAAASAQRERENKALDTTTPSSTETYLAQEMRPRWLAWIRSEVWKGKPGPLVRPRPLVDLCQAAPRALARDDLGEEDIGSWKTYLYHYVPVDLDTNGGPLHVELRTNRDGKVERWVSLAKERDGP
jgi:hypothetical protein